MINNNSIMLIRIRVITVSISTVLEEKTHISTISRNWEITCDHLRLLGVHKFTVFGLTRIGKKLADPLTQVVR